MSRVQAIERAFLVLGVLADGPLGVTDVAERTRLPKSTAARLLAALASEGVVEQLPGDTRYRLGARLAALAGSARATRGIVAVAHPQLADLATLTGEAAGLGVRDGSTVHYVDQVDSPNPVQIRDWTGTRVPMHAVSSGQIFLAFMPSPAVARFLASPLEAFTKRTITTASELLERLQAVRRDGYAWVKDEFAEGITSVAAPIADAGGEIVAAVHVHGPTYRFPGKREDDTTRAVVAAAARIGERLRA
jgi:DNA-binding IclR family transcriptional regulator